MGGDAPDDPYDTGRAGSLSDGGKGGWGGGGAGSGAAEPDAGSAGSDDSDASTAMPPQAGAKPSHYPLVDGATWTYHHEYPQNPSKMPWDEIASLRSTTYMDRPAFILEDEEDAQGETSASTMWVDGTRVLRVHKEVSVAGQLAYTTDYDPGFLRYDEAWLSTDAAQELSYDSLQICVMASTASTCAPGAMRTETTTHTYRVISLHSEVAVAAGTFDTIEIERVNVGDPAVAGDEETKRYWFAAGVGKVREEDQDTGATEELTDYSIP